MRIRFESSAGFEFAGLYSDSENESKSTITRLGVGILFEEIADKELRLFSYYGLRVLNTKITFETTKTLSVGGQNILKSTKARIDYQLINKNTNAVKSGFINTFPALSSSSNSLYTQEKSIQHIKERLIKSSAKSLYKRIKIIIRRLT